MRADVASSKKPAAHWQRCTIRQRATPCTAGIGPLSSISASAARCAPFQTRRLPGRLAINQPLRPMGVELHHPIANDLERHLPIFAASVRHAVS
jgi:hypothetical protein